MKTSFAKIYTLSLFLFLAFGFSSIYCLQRVQPRDFEKVTNFIGQIWQGSIPNRKLNDVVEVTDVVTAITVEGESANIQIRPYEGEKITVVFKGVLYNEEKFDLHGLRVRSSVLEIKAKTPPHQFFKNFHFVMNSKELSFDESFLDVEVLVPFSWVGDIKMQTTSGHIHLLIPAGNEYKFILKTQTGQIENEFAQPHSQDHESSEDSNSPQTSVILAETTSGNIEIQKSP